MMMKPHLVWIACAMQLAIGALAATPDPICGTWKWFDQNVRTFLESGTVANPAGRVVARWECQTPLAALGAERRYVVTFQGGKFVDTLTLKNGGTFLEGANNYRVHVTATRVGNAAAAVPPPAPASSVAPTSAPEDRFGGMALAPGWMPQKLDTRRELLLSLEFYAQKAVGNAQPGKELVPTTLVGPIRWLMPLEEAVKTLPERVVRTAEQRITQTCFPQGSLTWVAYQYKNFADKNQAFNLMLLILDAKRRVVGVQLRDQAANGVLWDPPGPDGSKEPYYNFVSLSHNGSSQNEVQYQVRSAGRGVTLIKTALYDHGKRRYLENVHWYLAAPFARSLLDIVEKNRQAGMLR